MISYLIDAVLLAALAVTSWRTGRMVRELRRLRSEEASFGAALREADGAIDRAAHAVVMLKSEGLKTLAGLEIRIEEARRLAERLDEAARLAEFELDLANDNGFAAPAAAPEAEWLRRIESRLAPASTLNR